MEAGRELDALIAEKVMDLKGLHFAENLLGTTHLMHRYSEPRTLPTPSGPMHDDGTALVPFYSTDIAAAWKIVEKLKTLISELKIELSSGSEHPDEWTVAVGWQDSEQGYGPFYFTQETAPHAICLAAFKAVEAKP